MKSQKKVTVPGKTVYEVPSYIEQRFSRGKKIYFWERGHFRRGIYAPTHCALYFFSFPPKEITSAGFLFLKKIIASPEISEEKKNGTLKKMFFLRTSDFLRAFYSSSPPRLSGQEVMAVL